MSDRLLDSVLRSSRFQARRGTAASWTSINPVLRPGEFGFEEDTGKLKIGDGSSHWVGLDYGAGVDGLSGEDGADGTSFTWRGAWDDDSVSYSVNDVVSNSGGAWICIEDNVSGLPPLDPPSEDPEHWDQMVMQGASGADGAAGESSPFTIFLDRFVSDRIAAEYIVSHAVYTADGGTLSIAAAGAVSTAVVDAQQRESGRITVQVQDRCNVIVAWLAAGDYIMARYDGLNARLDIRNSGVSTNVVNAGSVIWASGDFVRVTKQENLVTVENFATDPVAGAVALNSFSHTLAGADATKFGAGIAGRFGVGSTVGSTVGANSLRIEAI